MSSIINGFIVISLIITAAYFVGLLTFINDHEYNKCDMTYMYEYPQYVRVSNKIDDKYPKYGLYAYSEGRLTERARSMYFDGIPVVFIPGNAGSHKQGRSLASIALRKSIDSRAPFHFDHFAIDLNEELSGLNGALLADQLEYVNRSIYTILDLYKNNKYPATSIVLFGHSMGGIIARRLVASLPENSDLVPIVLTLASPHKRPPLLLDSYSYEFYKGINVNKTVNTTFISITGGHNDFLVPSYLTSISDPDSLNVVASQIPRSWILADHVCILWCKQTILALSRALFESVDLKTREISRDPKFRRDIFSHHLVHNSGTYSHLVYDYLFVTTVRNDGEWIEHFGRQYTVEVPPKVNRAFFYMIRLLKQPQHEMLTVVALSLDTVDWVFVCGAHIPRGKNRVCEDFTHLTRFSEIAPSTRYKRRSITINMHDLMAVDADFTHVVVRVLPTDHPVTLYVDVHSNSDRKLTLNLPNLLSLKRQTVIEETVEKAVRYELVLPQLYHVMQSYQLYVDCLKCTYHPRHATARLIVPWAFQTQYTFFTHNETDPFHVRLYESRPQEAANQSAFVELALDPNCRYKISIRSSILGVLGQMARFYSPLLLVNVAVVLLMTLNSQMKSMSTDRRCSLFFVAVKEGAKPYYILTSVKLISRFLSLKPIVNYFPPPDWLIMSQEGTDFFLLPLLLYICSVGLVWLLGIGLFVSLVVCESTFHKLALKFLAKTVTFTVSWSDHVMSALHKVPFVVAGALVSLSLTTTGSLALCVGTVFYFMRLTQLSQDYIEELVWYYVKKIGQKFKRAKPKKDEQKDQPSTSTEDDNEQKEIEEKKDNSNNNNNNARETSAHDAMFFHATLFLLWSLLAIINVPSVLTWAHNFKYSTTLHPDSSFIPGLILSICALPLWQLDLPKLERKGYAEIGHLISVLAVGSLIYAPISIFRLNYTLSAAIVLVTLHQLLAPNRDVVAESSRSAPPISFESIKAKLE